MNNYVPWYPIITLLDTAELSTRAAEVFSEEIFQKTGLSLERSEIYMPGRSNFVLCDRASFSQLERYEDRLSALTKPGLEGFSLFIVPEGGAARSVFIVGTDARGIFFGMGKLLRLLFLNPGQLMIDDAQQNFSDTPQYILRGQQLAYRDKQNTCPCWNQKDFDRYIRDLALFGNNAIEILPPRTDDNLYSRVFKVDPFEMMLDLSRIIHSYGMDVWLWYPNMGENYDDPLTRKAELIEREKVFSSIPYLDAILIPAGDPGHLNPDILFPVVEETAEMLHRYHPKATVWLAPQVFAPSGNWYDDFYSAVDKEPEWLYGLCFAPWERDTIEELYNRLPEKYKLRIRHYPDITHSLRSQFAMPDWDRSFQIIEGREVNNTRPLAMKHIHNMHAPYTVGSITYSEGIHDDLNKFIWSQQDWDAQQSSEVTVREYARYFIDPTLEDELTAAFFALEKNWGVKRPITENLMIDDTYRLWLALEAKASPSVRENYRFLMGLLRAISDYFVKYKQAYDDRLETEARAVLKHSEYLGADIAMRKAAAILRRGINQPWNEHLRMRQLELADQLKKLCGIKLTTHHHDGQSFRRGAYLDLIDFPLNDQQYLTVSFKRIRKLASEEEKLAAIHRLLNRTYPGDGGIYINLGSYESLKYIHFEKNWEEDPGMRKTAHIDLCNRALTDAQMLTGTYREQPLAKEWFMQAATYYETPLIVRVPGLDPNANYRLKMTYIEPGRTEQIRLTLGDGTVVHEVIETREVFDPCYTYPLPRSSYADGTLVLRWEAWGALGGAWVNELFLERI